MIHVKLVIVLCSLEIPKHMASLGSALNSEPQQMQGGMAIAVGGMKHEVTWCDRARDLRVLSLPLSLALSLTVMSQSMKFKSNDTRLEPPLVGRQKST